MSFNMVRSFVAMCVLYGLLKDLSTSRVNICIPAHKRHPVLAQSRPDADSTRAGAGVEL